MALNLLLKLVLTRQLRLLLECFSPSRAEHLGGTLLSFGGYVRELVKARGFALDRATLQTSGDGAVSADPHAFLEGVLANVASDWTHLIIEGVRHASILAELRKFAAREGAVLKLVHLYTSN